LQQPLALGADLVVHSSTKYLGGHSDVVGGFIATNDSARAERLQFLQNAVGAVPAPLDCWLVLRGVKTLAVRMERHCENARAIVDLLLGHPAVDRVLYPGLPEHAGHDVARKQMRDFGGMVSFTCHGGEDAALSVAAKTKLFALAESLGAVESLIEHPGRMTHASVAGSPLEVDASLVRLSVGIESQNPASAPRSTERFSFAGSWSAPPPTISSARWPSSSPLSPPGSAAPSTPVRAPKAAPRRRRTPPARAEPCKN